MKRLLITCAVIFAAIFTLMGCENSAKKGASELSNKEESLLLAPERVTMPKDKEWLGLGESITVEDYSANDSRTPANFSHINSSTLNANQQKGQKIYAKWCSSCHGIDMPATKALQALYKGDVPAVLEDRNDLSPELVELFVRNGKHSMPFFRKIEVNDEEMKLLGDYLGRNVK